ncbi:MAG: HEAT repeat domain-containing protein, partial [Bacteroidota bacterium]
MSLVSAAPQYVNGAMCEKYLKTLLYIAKEDYKQSRYKALKVSLDLLRENKAPDLCCMAIRALPALFKSVPKHIDENSFREAYEGLWQAAKSDDAQVSQAAARALVACIQAMPQHIHVHRAIHQVLQQGGGHKASEELRKSTITRLSDLLTTSTHPGERCAAASTLPALVAAAPPEQKEGLSELVLKTLQPQVSEEKSALVRCAVVNSLGELAKAVPEYSIAICDRLTRVVRADKEASVRSAAVAALGEFNEAKRVKEIRVALLEAVKDSYAAVRQAAASAIGKRVRDSKELDREYLKALLNLSREWSSSSVREAAIEALSNFTTQQLIEGYCVSLPQICLTNTLLWRPTQ